MTKGDQENKKMQEDRLENELNVFRQFLKSRALRITKEREFIARAVLLRHGHFDVDELFLSLRGQHFVSKASIYRTIPLLIESGLMSAVYLENGHMHYEKVYGRDQHSHLYCSSCSHIFEFSAPELDTLAQRAAEAAGFKSEGHKFEIWGICAKCRNKK